MYQTISKNTVFTVNIMKKEIFFNHRATSDSVLDEIRDRISGFIDEKRLNHTFFVEKEAITIAKSVFSVYNISDGYLNDISAAALLHDMTKKMDIKIQLALCNMHGIEAGTNPSNAILHGKTAAHMARQLFGINDFVFSAIFNHTTGCENMGLFDKIIFIADYTEESRIHEHCVKTRDFLHGFIEAHPEKAAEALDRAVLMSIDGTLSHLIETKRDIDIQTVLARNFILKELDTCGS